MEFSRQEHCSGLPFPSPGDLPDPGIKPGSPALQAYSLPSEPPEKHMRMCLLSLCANPRCDNLSDEAFVTFFLFPLPFPSLTVRYPSSSWAHIIFPALYTFHFLLPWRASCRKDLIKCAAYGQELNCLLTNISSAPKKKVFL